MGKTPKIAKRSKSKENEKADKRRAVIDAFIEIAAEEGVARVTLQQAANRAGVAFATAHHYFGNERANLLEEAIRAVAAHAQTFIVEWLAEDRDRKVYPLRSYIAGTIAWIRKYPAHAAVWIYYYHVLAYDRVWRKGHGPVLEGARERVRQLLIESIGLGALPGGSVGDETPRQVHALIVAGTMLGTAHDTESPAATLRWTLAGCEAMVRAKP
jgi:AcrR family transcriptional regulator